MEITWKKLRAFFGLPETATTAEVDAKLDEALAQRDQDETPPEARDEGADAGAHQAPPEPETTEDTPDLGDLQAQLDAATQAVSQLGAEVQALTVRIKKMEESDAAPETGGEREAADINEPKARAYEHNPLNKEVAKRFEQ